MPRVIKPLSELAVRKLATKPGRHAVGGASGLHLFVKSPLAASWVLRMLVGGVRRDIGLGSFRDVPLAAARDAALRIRLEARTSDPVEARRAEREARRAARLQSVAAAVSFEMAAREWHAAKLPEYRSHKHGAAIMNTLTKYALPVLGQMPVMAVDRAAVLQVIEPIWSEKTRTAKDLRCWLESILDFATAKGYRSGDNPARWKGALEHALANPRLLLKRKQQHHAALRWQQVPAFMAALRAEDGNPARVLEFAILTAARNGEVRAMTWGELDLEAGLWTVPAAKMKAGKAHRVPLSPAALALLRSLPQGAGDELVFPSAKGLLMRDQPLLNVIKRLHEVAQADGGAGWVDPDTGRIATPHGIARSCFKDWARNQPGHVDEVSELALAHVNSDATRAAYSRDELLTQRRVLMNQWADYLASGAEDNVVDFPLECSA